MSARQFALRDCWLILAGANFLTATASLVLGFIAAGEQRRPWLLLVGALMCGWFAFMCDLCLNRWRDAVWAASRPSAGGRQP